MKKINIALPLAVLAIGAVSCSTEYNIYPDEYAKGALIQNAGVHEMVIYSSAEKAEYPVTVIKSGHEKGAAMQAKLRIMTEAEFNEYLTESGKPYSYLPNNCYEINGGLEQVMDFSGDKTYENTSVVLKPRVINTFMEGYNDPLRRPVIPMVLESENGHVDKDLCENFILFDLKVTKLRLSNEAASARDLMTPLDSPTGTTQLSIPVVLPVENEWDFDVVMEYDESLITGFYKPLPMEAIQGLSAKTFTLHFPKGTNQVNIDLTIDNTKIGATPMVLPLHLKSSTLKEIAGVDIDTELSELCYYFYYLPKMTITSDMITAGDCHYGDGGNEPALCDGDPNTYYHSRWDTGALHNATYGSWLQYNLAEPVQTISFEIYARHNNANGRPVQVGLWCWNGEAWEKFATASKMTDQLTGAGSHGTFGPYTAPVPFQYLIFGVEEAVSGSLLTTAGTFWACGEITFFGGL